MRNTICVGAFLTLATFCVAQPALSKRDLQKKAAFEKQIADEEKYEELMQKADGAFQKGDYVTARMTFEEAIDYNKDNEQWLISKVNDLDILMAKNVARAVDSIIVDMPSKKPVVLSEEQVLVETIDSRKMPDKPEVVVEKEEVPEEQVAEAPTTPKAAPAEVEESAKRVVEEVEEPVEKVKVKEDFSAFKEGITEEVFDYPNHQVLRVVYKQELQTVLYKRVKHRWGGEFYFVDDVSVSKRYWMEELQKISKKLDHTPLNF